jgi:hypothetical protein
MDACRLPSEKREKPSWLCSRVPGTQDRKQATDPEDLGTTRNHVDLGTRDVNNTMLRVRQETKNGTSAIQLYLLDD